MMESERKSLIPLFTRVVIVLKWVWIAAAVLTTAFAIAIAVSPGIVQPSLLRDGNFSLNMSWNVNDGTAASIPLNPAAGTKELVVTELFTVVALALLALGALILSQLQTVLQTIRDKETFDTEIPHRLSVMGALVIGAGVVNAIGKIGAFRYAMTAAQRSGGDFSMTLHFDVTLLLAGFVLFVLAEIFRRGNELQEEHDLTV